MANSLAVRYATLSRFPDYRFGDDGSVWSQKYGNWRRLKPSYDGYGYRIVPLSVNGRRHMTKVPRVILEAFCGPAADGQQCCHNNGIRDDDRLSNLRWDTAKGNTRDKLKHGTAIIGEAHHNALLTEKQVRVSRALYSRGYTCGRIAEWFGVSLSTVFDAVTGRSWRHLQGDIQDARREVYRNGCCKNEH